MLADVTVLNQFGFILVTASLADTFIVRTMLVPALLGFFPETNWWPGKVPPPLKSHLVDVGGEDEEEDESAGEGVGIFDHDVLA